MKISNKTKKIIFKVFKKKINNEKDLSLKISNIADSLKFMELFVQIEKETKKKFNPSQLKTIKNINDLF
tara:strand:+ start:1016 stop:1222 length:207 start_codon:yes stop_codon:yes gene_type:complete